MNWKRTVLLILSLGLIGAASVYADDIYETIRAKKTTVQVSGKTISGYSIQSNGKLLVPMDELTETMQVFVEHNGDEVTIHKPNVHIFLFSVAKDKITSPFGYVTKGGEYDFAIFTQADSLAKPVESIKYEIIDPNDEKVYTAKYPLKIKEDYFWQITPTITLKFQHTGEYKVYVYMQLDPQGDYQLVSKKVIKSLPK